MPTLFCALPSPSHLILPNLYGNVILQPFYMWKTYSSGLLGNMSKIIELETDIARIYALAQFLLQNALFDTIKICGPEDFQLFIHFGVQYTPA